MKIIIVYTIFAMYMMYTATALPDGAPLEACESMVPVHNVSAQDSPAPYTFTIADNEGSYEVVLTADSAESPFKGVIFQARGGDTTPLGTWAVVDDTNTQTLDCGGVAGSALTHTNNNDKETITATWTPGEEGTDGVTITGTVVQAVDIFWIGLSGELP